MHFKLKSQILWVVLFNFASFRAFCPKAVQSTYFPVSFSEGKWSLCRLASSCVLRGRLWTKQRVSVSCITGHRFSKPLFELRPDAGCTVLAAVRHQAFRLGAFYLSGLTGRQTSTKTLCSVTPATDAGVSWMQQCCTFCRARLLFRKTSQLLCLSLPDVQKSMLGGPQYSCLRMLQATSRSEIKDFELACI
jgi:hypothetical protein